MDYKWWLLIAALLFVVGLILGLTAFPDSPDFLSRDINGLKQFAGLLAPLPPWSLFGFIFIKNVAVLVLSFILSPLLCLVPILALTLNGWFLGWVSGMVLQEEPLSYLLAGLLPHGIFELPALIMGEAAALSFGRGVMLALFKRGGNGMTEQSLKRNFVYLMWAIALFLPAAIIEAFVTPLFLR
ncbi:MAG: stage II sporulation protein M [Chloroflexi bacterium]|nr:stage II sporulation protein M [Chloroflexota bacterium]